MGELRTRSADGLRQERLERRTYWRGRVRNQYLSCWRDVRATRGVHYFIVYFRILNYLFLTPFATYFYSSILYLKVYILLLCLTFYMNEFQSYEWTFVRTSMNKNFSLNINITIYMIWYHNCPKYEYISKFEKKFINI